MAIVATLMKTELITASPRDTVAAVTRQMMNHGIGAVPVVENGALVGLFSERDLLRRVVAAGHNPATVYVGDVATHAVTWVTPETHLAECVKIFNREGFRHLAVLEQGRLVGMLSARDLFAHVTAALEHRVDDEQYRARIDAGEDPYDHVGGGYIETR